jgi:DNA end-binding protein Ku
MAAQLIEAMTGEFDPAQYRDEYREALMEVIESKIEGRETVNVEAPEEGTKLVDLMAALQASVKAATDARGAKSEKPVSVDEARSRRAARGKGDTDEAKTASKAAREAKAPRAAETRRRSRSDERSEEKPARRRKTA